MGRFMSVERSRRSATQTVQATTGYPTWSLTACVLSPSSLEVPEIEEINTFGLNDLH